MPRCGLGSRPTVTTTRRWPSTATMKGAVQPRFTVRFRWEPGSVAFWDNRSTAHLAPVDIFDTDFDRQFYRVTLMGDVPVGPDGSPSTIVEGEPIKPA